MFNVEPQEKWGAEEAANFERHAAAELKRTTKAAAWAGVALFVTILGIVPF